MVTDDEDILVETIGNHAKSSYFFHYHEIKTTKIAAVLTETLMICN